MVTSDLSDVRIWNCTKKEPENLRLGAIGLTLREVLSQVPERTFSRTVFVIDVIRPQRWSIFQGDGMVNVFLRPPLPSMVFQWF